MQLSRICGKTSTKSKRMLPNLRSLSLHEILHRIQSLRLLPGQTDRQTDEDCPVQDRHPFRSVTRQRI